MQNVRVCFGPDFGVWLAIAPCQPFSGRTPSPQLNKQWENLPPITPRLPMSHCDPPFKPYNLDWERACKLTRFEATWTNRGMTWWTSSQSTKPNMTRNLLDKMLIYASSSLSCRISGCSLTRGQDYLTCAWKALKSCHPIYHHHVDLLPSHTMIQSQALVDLTSVSCLWMWCRFTKDLMEWVANCITSADKWLTSSSTLWGSKKQEVKLAERALTILSGLPVERSMDSSVWSSGSTWTSHLFAPLMIRHKWSTLALTIFKLCTQIHGDFWFESPTRAGSASFLLAMDLIQGALTMKDLSGGRRPLP